MPDHLDGILFARHEALAEKGQVLMVPRVPVRNGGPVGHARDLVAVVPPGHHARVLRGVVPQPPVRLAEVIDDHRRPVAVAAAQHDLRLRKVLRHGGAVVLEVVHASPHAHHRKHRHHLAREGVVVVRADQQVLDVSDLHGQAGTVLGVLLRPLGLLGALLRLQGLALGGSVFGGGLGLVVLVVTLLLRLVLREHLKHAPLHCQRRKPPRADRRRRAQDQNQTHHLAAEVRGHKRVGDDEPLRVGTVRKHRGEPEGRVVEHVVEVQPVRVRASGLVLCDRVHEGVAGGGVLNEEGADTVGDGAKETSRDDKLNENAGEHNDHHDNLKAESGKVSLVHLVLTAHDLTELQHLNAEKD
mmetsp:Transcript_10385/g.17856  ORF Transcript_10385/g.17856 Transcript_10385/m.17856 type:complete len:356 (+) Transcript_10385:876-1943(+)